MTDVLGKLLLLPDCRILSWDSLTTISLAAERVSLSVILLLYT